MIIIIGVLNVRCAINDKLPELANAEPISKREALQELGAANHILRIFSQGVSSRESFFQGMFFPQIHLIFYLYLIPCRQYIGQDMIDTIPDLLSWRLWIVGKKDLLEISDETLSIFSRLE